MVFCSKKGAQPYFPIPIESIFYAFIKFFCACIKYFLTSSQKKILYLILFDNALGTFINDVTHERGSGDFKSEMVLRKLLTIPTNSIHTVFDVSKNWVHNSMGV